MNLDSGTLGVPVAVDPCGSGCQEVPMLQMPPHGGVRVSKVSLNPKP